MYPKLFGVIPTFTLMVGLGLISAVALYKFIAVKQKVDDDSYNFYSMTGVVAIGAGFLFATLFQSVYNWIDDGFKNFHLSGMTFLGGLIGAVAAFLIVTAIFAKPKVKRDFWRNANLIAPCIVSAHMFGRIGCFLGGCCYGKDTTSFVGVKFVDFIYKSSGEWVYFASKKIPTQLFEAIFLAILLAVMLVLIFKYKRSDFIMILYLYAYAVFRFIIEFFRGDPRGKFLFSVLSPSQAQSIVMLLIAVTLTVLIYKFKWIPWGKAKDKKNLTASPPPINDENNSDT